MPVVFYVLFATSFIPVLLAFLSGYTRYKDFGYFDNNYPREQQSRQTGFGARVVAAQKNAWESLIIFLLVVFIANASGVEMQSLTTVSLTFLFLRILHAAFYLANLGALRSLAYVTGNICCIYIFYISAVNFS